MQMSKYKLVATSAFLLSIVLSPLQKSEATKALKHEKLIVLSPEKNSSQTASIYDDVLKAQVSQETGLSSLQGKFSAYSLPTDPPKKSDTTFVVSDGLGFDFLARRENLGPTGRLDLKPIEVKRVFSDKLDEVLTNGFPDNSKPLYSKLIANGVLPQYAKLTFEVGDVDDKTDI